MSSEEQAGQWLCLLISLSRRTQMMVGMAMVRVVIMVLILMVTVRTVMMIIVVMVIW